MKKVAMLIFVISLFACDKYPFLPDNYSESFTGNWKWYGTSCPNSGSYQSADSAKYSIRMTFDWLGKYNYYKNDVLLFRTGYHFTFDQSHNGTNHYKLKLDNNVQPFDVFMTKFNSTSILVIADTYPDGCEVYYGRQ
jgi:hypothetical protein